MHVVNYLSGCCCLDLMSRCPLHDEFLRELLGLSEANYVPVLETQVSAAADISTDSRETSSTAATEVHVWTF